MNEPIDITPEGIAQACENSYNWLMHGHKTGPCIAAPQFAEAARLLRAQAARVEQAEPRPMTREWCSAFPGAAAGIINTLANRLDAQSPAQELTDAQIDDLACEWVYIRAGTESSQYIELRRFARAAILAARGSKP